MWPLWTRTAHDCLWDGDIATDSWRRVQSKLFLRLVHNSSSYEQALGMITERIQILTGLWGCTCTVFFPRICRCWKNQIQTRETQKKAVNARPNSLLVHHLAPSVYLNLISFQSLSITVASEGGILQTSSGYMVVLKLLKTSLLSRYHSLNCVWYNVLSQDKLKESLRTYGSLNTHEVPLKSMP